jgi:hypothetical protein
MTSLSSTIKKLGARHVPFGYSLSLTITETNDEQCLGTWVLLYTHKGDARTFTLAF